MERVEGIIPPVITPLLNENRLDIQGVERLTEHLISGGVHGLFLLGTTGEGPSLKRSLHIELVKKVCEHVNGRLPVWVGLLDTSFKESVSLANKAAEMGARALVVAPPFFYQIDQSELYHFIEHILDETSLPIYLYNNPGLTKIAFELKTIRKLLPREKIRGIKDSSGDMIYFQRVNEIAEEFDIAMYMGPEELLMESLIMGGSGGVPGGANILPEWYVNMYDSVKNGDLNHARELQNKIMKLTKIVYGGKGYIAGRVVNGIKSALKYLDICNDYVAKPLSKAGKEKREKIKQFLDEYALA